jgi:hypothetical protein
MILEDTYINTLEQLNITQTQLLFLILAYKRRIDLVKKYKTMFPTDDNSMIGDYYINDLIKKELLIPNGDGFKLGDKFLSIYINKHTATEEIFDIYPNSIEIDGSFAPLTVMDRNVFANLYEIAIQSSYLEHLEVIKDINYGIENRKLNLKIENFLKSKYWLNLRKERLLNNIQDKVKLPKDFNF